MPWSAHGLGIDKDTVRELLVRMLLNPDALLSVVEIDGEIAGACVMALHRYHLNRNTVMAIELMWHMRPSFPDGPAKVRWFLRLLDHMRAWARKRGAQVILLSTQHKDASLGRALERRGLRPYEAAFTEVL
jgi:hypothetical protein